VLQNLIPRMMLAEVPAETIYSQMDYLATEMADDARRLVRAVCGPLPGEDPRAAAMTQDDGGPLGVGAMRSAGRVSGKVLATRAPVEPIPDSEALRGFFENHLAAYLLRGAASGSQLAMQTRATHVFDDLRTKLPSAAHGVVATLEGFAEQRRQWDYQARLHVWLHNWLVVHFAASSALIVLMALHVYVALRYW